MTDLDQTTSPHVSNSPEVQESEATVSTNTKEDAVPTPVGTPKVERQSDSAQGDSLSSDSSERDLMEQLTKEIWKLIAAICVSKKNYSKNDQSIPLELINLVSQMKVEKANKRHLLSPRMIEPSRTPTRNQPNATSTKQPKKVAQSTTKPQGPFIRVVSKSRATLVHMGQLVGILDDRSGLLLQRVVSYDPKRVKLDLLAKLTPSEILGLTETKAQQMAKNEKRSKNLLSQLIATCAGLEVKPGIAEIQSEFFGLTEKHGPVLTTPGLVMIRIGQIREISILSDDTADDIQLEPKHWCKEIEQIQQQKQGNLLNEAVPSKEMPSTSTESSPQSVNVILSSNDSGTPIDRAKLGIGHVSSSAMDGEQKIAAAIEEEPTVVVETQDQKQPTTRVNKEQGCRRRIIRRRGGRRRTQQINKASRNECKADNQPNQAQHETAQVMTQTQTGCRPLMQQQPTNVQPVYHDNGIAIMGACQHNANQGGCGYQHNQAPRQNCQYRPNGMQRRFRVWNTCHRRCNRCINHY